MTHKVPVFHIRTCTNLEYKFWPSTAH